jgi:hypothetical protein
MQRSAWRRTARSWSAALLASVLAAGCSPRDLPSVDRENLFGLTIGKLEDQIDLFDLEGRGGETKVRLAMRDGIFFISDGAGAKVVRYTSYGDLLSMVYNPDTNPPPLTLSTAADGDGVVTRRAVPYPLNAPGELAVDSRKHLYVEDRLPADRRIFDAERGALLDSVVLHFDGNDQFVEYLGQEGVGGTPFPYILSLAASADDEIVVTCRLASGWQVYWFDRAGNPLYVIHLDRTDLPRPVGRDVQPSLDSIVAAPDGRRLFLKIDYYRDLIDESTTTRSGIGNDGSMIWVMDVATGAYLEQIEVPAYEKDTIENDRSVVTEHLYSLIGVARGGRIFLAAPDEGGYALLLLHTGSRDQKRGFIRVDDSELQFNAFHLSADGILSALLASTFEAKTVWWRTDVFIGEPRT